MIRISLAVAAVLFAGCGKKDDKGSSSAKPTEGGAAVKLAKLGLQLDIPEEAEVGDGMSENALMITGSGIGAMHVEPAKAPQTVDEAKSDASMYSPKNLKTEALADGWMITFENAGGAGPGYWVDAQRKIDGKTYRCGTTGHDPDQARNVAAACKSLRK